VSFALRRLLLGAALLALPALASAAGEQRWTQGSLSVRLLEAGYLHDSKSGAWEGELVLRFVNLSQERRFNQGVQIRFLDPKGAQLGVWKTFLSLSPGQAQHRRVRAPGQLGCHGDLAACQPLRVALLLRGSKASQPYAEIPRKPLEEEGAPPEGQTLYVARVLDGESFQLLEGQKIHLLGVDAPGRKGVASKPEPGAREAKDYLSQRVMDASVTLSFDGERRDQAGRWLALVRCEDGGLLNQELLQKGLARLDPHASFALKPDFEKAQTTAQAAGQGLWAPARSH
jgi:endonuclease YncB( thermonuclease family)